MPTVRHTSGRSGTQAAPEPMTRSHLLEDDAPPIGARAIVLAAALALVGGGVWAHLATVREIVSVAGVVAPEGAVRRIEHLDGGVVASVAAAPGEAVRAGQPLVSLDAGALLARQAQLQARLEGLAREIDRQHAVAGAATPVPPPRGDDSDIARAQHAAAEVADAHRASRLAVLEARVALYEADAEALTRRREAMAAERGIVAARHRQFDEAHRRTGAVSGVARDNVALQLLQLDREIATLGSEAATALLRAHETREAQAEFLAEGLRQAFERVAELEPVRAELTAELRRIEESLERSVVRAPADGRLLTLGVRAAGQVLAPGDLVAEIVPDAAPLVVEIDLPADRVGWIDIGMPASVRADTFNHLRWGDVASVVESVAPSSVVDRDGALVYAVRLRLAASHVGPAEAGLRLAPGMTVTVDLQGERQSVLSRLLRPLHLMRERALTES